MSLKPADLKEDQDVLLKWPDGYTMQATYRYYLSEIQRYRFDVHVGGVDRTHATQVLFHRDTVQKCEITEDPEAQP